MARRDTSGIFKTAALGAVLVGGASVAAQANELSLSASTNFTTDYVFRGISQTDNNPAVQGSLDAAYGIFYLGMWGSNVDFGGGPFGQDIANLEIDYYAGITPSWNGIDFDIGGIWYTYPGAYDPGGEFDYFELKTGASYSWDSFSFAVTNYWSPEFTGEVGVGNATELAGEYSFGTLFNTFDTSFSAGIGFQYIEDGEDYTYWNAGLTLGFMENFAADIRYHDTDGCGLGGNLCDSRVVGSLSASF